MMESPSATPRVVGRTRLPKGGMMAPDQPYQPHPRNLSAETTAALREAVVRHLERGSDGDDSLGRAVSIVVAEARERDMRAEELILAFKTLYDALPEPKSAVARAEQVHLRERLVSACIRAYYNHEDSAR
jgi:hypothetical protein